MVVGGNAIKTYLEDFLPLMDLLLLFSHLCSFVDLFSPFTYFHLIFYLSLLLLLPSRLNLSPIHDGTTLVVPYNLHAPSELPTTLHPLPLKHTTSLA